MPPMAAAGWSHWQDSHLALNIQKGRDNAVADALSHVASNLNAEAVKSILDSSHHRDRGKGWCPWPGMVAEANERIHKQVEETGSLRPMGLLTCTCKLACNRLGSCCNNKIPYSKLWWSAFPPIKYRILNILLRDNAMMEVGMAILRECRRNSCSIRMPSIIAILQPESWKKLMWFAVPIAHTVMQPWMGAIGMLGHQGQWQTLSLLWDQFWWPAMAMEMQKVISSCESCIQHEGAQAKAPLQAILVTSPLELLHVDFTGIETTMGTRPTITHSEYFGLLWPLHETHVSGICDSWSDCKRLLAKFLWQGYISIFGAPAKFLSDLGANLESNIINDLCELMGIWKARTLLYTPRLMDRWNAN